MEENPDGYFINITGPRTGRLHRGDCPHLRGCESVSLVSKQKWTADDRRDLQAWVRKEAVELLPCDTSKCQRADPM
jgi:hypothetical protein